jgi:predicted RNA-binding Zn-ribbon protein involved in translation (DUF1610 family)
MRFYHREDIPNAFQCNSCGYSGSGYQFVRQSMHPNVKRGTWYTNTFYKCPNCNTENRCNWELGDDTIGILGAWNGEEIPSEKHMEEYKRSHNEL